MRHCLGRKAMEDVFQPCGPNGMRQVLKNNADRLNATHMREVLHEHIKSEKPKVTTFSESKGHTTLSLPKFHPEINPIECV